MPNWPATKLMDNVVGIDVHTAAARLQQAGLSALGAMQALRSQPVTAPEDRNLIARILTAAVARETR